MTEILTGIYSLMNLQARAPIARLIILAQHENNYLDIQDNYFINDLIENQNECKKNPKKQNKICLPFYTLFLSLLFIVISTKT